MFISSIILFKNAISERGAMFSVVVDFFFQHFSHAIKLSDSNQMRVKTNTHTHNECSNNSNRKHEQEQKNRE